MNFDAGPAMAEEGREARRQRRALAAERERDLEQQHYMEVFVERASSLSPRESPLHSTEQQVKSCSAQKWLDDGTCACGAAFMDNARFCFQCGNPIAGKVQNNDFGRHVGSCEGHPDAVRPQNSMDSLPTRCSSRSDATCAVYNEYARQFVPAAQWADGALEDSFVANAITTLMMCDIPCRRNIQQIVDVIDSMGFAGTYDFVYMPPQKQFQCSRQSNNMGYAFVNFKTPVDAAAFWRVSQYFVFPQSSSKKVSYTKPAHCQGYDANVDMHEKKSHTGSVLLF